MTGRELDGYHLVRELGVGGMGTVHLAEKSGEQFALKVVHPHLIAAPGILERFVREAELGRKVSHPNVVRTFDVGATTLDDQPLHYMVMEFVEGKSLRELLFELRTFPATLLREVMLQTAAGLAAIHEHDIIHRDLKPENVLITDDNEVRVMDLGVAKLQEATIAITEEGQFAGTLLYAAPELFGAGEVGPASDQYSLGVMLYELATGENPFRRDDPAQIFHAQLEYVPARLDELDGEFSGFVAEVAATLLAKSAGERFESVAQLQEVLAKGENSDWWGQRARTLAHRESALPHIRVHRETELHGRADDLAVLLEAWARAGEGLGNTVLIEGEAGIGKTRLMDTLIRELGDAHMLYGSYPPSGGQGGLSDAIVGKFGDRDLENALRPYLPGMPALVPAFAALIRHEPPPTGSEPLRGDALHAVCVQLMRALAAERPTVWIVDDLQFADRDSRDLVHSLARATEGHRILLLVTSRPGLPEEELAHFSRLESLRRLALCRLSPRETLDLLADALKSDALAEKLGGKIALKSDGVPFFVFEMIRGLREGQFLQKTLEGTYVLSRVIDDIEVPSAVKDLIDGRMKGLSERQRAILDVGAVQGMSFDPGLVAAVLEEKRIRVLRDIAEIERRFGLLRGEDAQIRFDQTQIQEVVYAALIPELRREYHAALADAYEGDDPSFRARHHLLGSRPKRGLEYVDPALDRLLAAYRNESAMELIDLALCHLEGKERAKLLLRKCSRLRIVGRVQDASDAAEEAHELAASADDDGLVLEVLAQRAAVAEAAGALDDAETLARESLELVSRTGERILEARAQTRLGSIAYNRRRYADSLAHHESAVAIYHELGDPAEETAVTSMGSALTALRRLPEALECQQRGLAAARGAGDRNREGGALGNLGNVHFYSGRLDEAEEHWEQAREIGAELGNRAFEAISTANIGESRALKGELAATLDAAQRVLELQTEIGARGQVCQALVTLTTRNLQLGRIEQAKELAERADALASELGEPWARQILLRFGMIAAMDGDRAAAEQHFRDVLDRARAESDSGYTLSALLGLARLGIDGADALLGELAPMDEPEAQVLVPALLGQTAAARAAIEEHGVLVGVIPRMEAYLLVGDIEQAHALLRHMREHAPEECRDSMVERVPLYREIEEAWNARGMLNERRPAGPADPTGPGPASPGS